MAFRKLARVQTLGWGEAGAGFNLTAAAEAAGQDVGLEIALPRQRSYYLDGTRKLDVRDLLSRVAEVYAINDDPSTYFFEAIRANTTNAPNENNDAFHQSELLRFDVKLGMPVYRTYAGKPHHLNHRTENPKAARGVIIDAHYNSDAPPLDTCPGCNIRTAERVNRDETGLHCKKCGTLVRDEFVEILVGIDTTKDPLFAEGVRKGTLKAGSMGCNCLSTTCNVCNHVAYARPDFCEHIRSGNKGSIWVRKGSGWVKSNARDVSAELRRRKHAFVQQDFCYAKADGFEARRAFENCNYVIFDEYSRVDQPADPKALQVEILKAASLGARGGIPSFDELRSETEALIRSATKKRRAVEASMQRQALGSPGPDMPYVSGDLEHEAVGLQLGPDGQPIVEMNPNDQQLVIQPSMNGQPPMGPGGQPGAPGAPGGPESIEQFTNQEVGPPGQPPPGEALNKFELGFGTGPDQQDQGMGQPQQSSAPPRTGGRRPKMRMFANAYAKWTVEITEQGNAMLRAADKTPVLVIKATAPTQDPEERRAFGKAVLGSLFEEGLVGTAKKYKAFFSPRFAGVVDHAVDDFVGFTDKYMFDSVLENVRTDMEGNATSLRVDPTQTREHASEGDDMQGDVRDYGSPHKDVLVDGLADNDERPTGYEDPVKEDHETMREKRKMIDVGQNSVLQDEVHDHVEPLHGKKGGADARRPNPPAAPAALQLGASKFSARDQKDPDLKGAIFTLRSVVASLDAEEKKLFGSQSYLLARKAADGTVSQVRVGHEDLLQKWIMLDKGPAQVKRPGQPVEAAKVCGAEHCKTFVKADAEYCGAHSSMKDSDGADKEAGVSRMPVAAAAVNEEVARRVRQAERLEKFAQAKLEKAKRELEAVKRQVTAEKQTLGKATVEAYTRAMRIAARRMQADLEQAPLKLAAEAVLSEARPVGRDAATGNPILYRGLDPELTRYLVAQLYEVGHADHLEQLMKRAAELMTKGDQYLLDAEADLKNVKTALPELTNARTAEIDEAGMHAEAMRRRASNGNLRFSPAPTPEEGGAGGTNGHDKRAAIRGALGGTLVEAARGRLGLN